MAELDEIDVDDDGLPMVQITLFTGEPGGAWDESSWGMISNLTDESIVRLLRRVADDIESAPLDDDAEDGEYPI